MGLYAPFFIVLWCNTMIDLQVILIIILLFLNLICLGLGYLFGMLNHSRFTTTDETRNIYSSQPNKTKNIEKIEIDTSKIVTKIKTDDLEKKYTSLGETKSSQENIQSSVNKLKNMKG
jgi:hypothetical protein